MAPPLSDRVVTFPPSWTRIPTRRCRNSCGYCVFVGREGPRAAEVAGRRLPPLKEAAAEPAHAHG